MEEWRIDLERVIQMDVDHISCYSLTLEEGSFMETMVRTGKLPAPDDDLMAEMMDFTEEFLRGEGFLQYEISNFARPGHACRHNINYWRQGEYIGVGPSAASFLAGKRMKNVADLERYMELVSGGVFPAEIESELHGEDLFREAVVLALRTSQGFHVEEGRERWGIELFDFYGSSLAPFFEADLLLFENGHLRLTSKGRRLSNLVFSELI